jgi:cell division protease FtsH
MHSEPDYSDDIARQIDTEIRRIIEDAYQRAKDILSEHRNDLENVTQVLLRRETIERDEFLRLLEGEAEADVFRVKDERARQKAAEDERAAAEAESESSTRRMPVPPPAPGQPGTAGA